LQPNILCPHFYRMFNEGTLKLKNQQKYPLLCKKPFSMKKIIAPTCLSSSGLLNKYLM
jgi:hypothetical protein